MTSPGEAGTERRERLLARTRRISLGVAAGAAAGSLVLGTALAHAVPGRPAAASSRPPAATARPQAPRTRPPGRLPARAPARPVHHIRPPRQAPASTPAAPQVSSGGS